MILFIKYINETQGQIITNIILWTFILLPTREEWDKGSSSMRRSLIFSCGLGKLFSSLSTSFGVP